MTHTPLRNSRSSIAFLLLSSFLWISCSGSNEEWTRKGEEELDAGRNEEAIASFEKSIAVEKSMQAYNGRGIAYFELEKYDEAIISFTQALELDATSYKPWFNRGNAKLQLRDFEGAIADYNRAAELQPDIPDIFMNRGNCHYYLNLTGQALNDFYAAIRLDSSNHLAWFNLGKTMIRSKRFEEALTPLTTAVELDGSYAPAHYWMGASKVELGDKEGGCIHFRQAALLGDPNAPRAVAALCGSEQ